MKRRECKNHRCKTVFYSYRDRTYCDQCQHLTDSPPEQDWSAVDGSRQSLYAKRHSGVFREARQEALEQANWECEQCGTETPG